jgi:hypothetical protein
VCVKRNGSVSFKICQAALMMVTVHWSETCLMGNASMSVELQQAAATLMETVRPAEVWVNKSATRDEAGEHLTQHFSQGSGIRRIKLFFKQIVRHGSWMQSCCV